jgi:hypothetical protein
MISLTRLFRNKQKSAARTLEKFVQERLLAAGQPVDDRRREGRAMLNVPIYLVPLRQGTPVVDEYRCVLGKDVSTGGQGIGLFSDEAVADSEMLLIVPDGQSPICLRAEKKTTMSLGGGFYLVGVAVTEQLDMSDFPQLADLERVVKNT